MLALEHRRPAGERHEDQLHAGAFHTCAVTTAGQAWCWGSDFRGMLGDGTEGEFHLSPEMVVGP